MKIILKLMIFICVFLTGCSNLFADKEISDDVNQSGTVLPTTTQNSYTATESRPPALATSAATQTAITNSAAKDEIPTAEPIIFMNDFDLSNDFKWLFSVVSFEIYKTNMDEKTTEKWVDPGFEVTTIELSQDDAYMGVGGLAGELCIYETVSAELLGCYDDHETSIFFIEFSNNGEYLATNSADEIILWAFENGNLHPTDVNVHNPLAQGIHFDDKSTALYYNANRGGINKVGLADNSVVKIFPEEFRPNPIGDFEIVDDDLFLAFGGTASDELIFTEWDMDEGKVLRKIKDPLMKIHTIRKIPNSNHLILYEENGIYLFNPETGTLNFVLEIQNPNIMNRFKFSDQSLNKVTFIDDEGIIVLDMTTWTISCRIQFNLDFPYTEFVENS